MTDSTSGPDGDRLFNIGWATHMHYPVVDGPAGAAGDYSGLTLPREVHYDPRTEALVSNPVPELAGLRNATLFNLTSPVQVSDGTPRLLPGTEGGAAGSADIELRWRLPAPDQASAVFGARVLAAPAPSGQGGNGNDSGSGVEITVVVAAAGADGRRAADLTVASGGGGGGGGVVRSTTTPFTVLPGEASVDIRIVVDRIIVEVFVQGGRVAFTRSYYPATHMDTGVQLLVSNGTAAATAATVWSMGCGWVGVDEQAAVWR